MTCGGCSGEAWHENAPVTRRALLGATTAAFGAVSLPAAASALAGLADPDAELFRLLGLWHEASAAWDTGSVSFASAFAKAEAAYPPIPDALRFVARDTDHDLGSANGRDVDVSSVLARFYHHGDVDRLRKAPPMTVWGPYADDEPPFRVPDPAGEARRQEIIEAHDAWMAARKPTSSPGHAGAVLIKPAPARLISEKSNCSAMP